MSTVYSNEFIVSNPDVQIPGPSLIPNELMKKQSVTNHLDNVYVQKVLSREELVQNYAQEKKVGHLSGQLASACQNVDNEIARHKMILREKDESLRQQIAERERVESLLTVAERQLVSVKESNTHLRNEIEHNNKNAHLISKEYMSAIEKNQQTSSKYEHFEDDRKQMNQTIESLKRELDQTKHLKRMVEEKLETAESANVRFLNGGTHQHTGSFGSTNSAATVEKLMILNSKLREKLSVKERLLERTTVAFNDLLYDYKYLYEETKKACAKSDIRAKQLYVNDRYDKWSAYNTAYQQPSSSTTPKGDALSGTIHLLKQQNGAQSDRQISEVVSRMQDQLEKMTVRNDELKLDNKSHVVENKKMLASIKHLQTNIDRADVYFTELENLKHQLSIKEEQASVHDAYIKSLKDNCNDLVQKVQNEHSLRIKQLGEYHSMQSEVDHYKDIIARNEKDNDEKVADANQQNDAFDNNEFRKEVAVMLAENFNKCKSIVADATAQTQNNNKCISEQKSSQELMMIAELKRKIMMYEEDRKVAAEPSAPPAPVIYNNSYTVSGDGVTEKKNNSDNPEYHPVVKNLEKKIKQLSEQLIEQKEELVKERLGKREELNCLEMNNLNDKLEKEVEMLNARLNHAEHQKQDLDKRLNNKQQELLNELLANQKQVAEEQKNDDSAVMDLKHQIDKLNSKLKYMEDEKEALNSKVDDTQQELLSVKLTAKKKNVDNEYVLKGKASLKKDIDELGARIASVESHEQDFNDRLYDTQQDLLGARLAGLRSHEESIKKFNSDLKELEEEVTMNVQQEIKQCRENVEEKIGMVEGLRKRDTSRIVKLRNRQKDALAKQRDDFAKFEHAQRQSITRLERDVFCPKMPEPEKVLDNHVTQDVRNKLSALSGVNDNRFNAVMDLQERAYATLCDRLDRLEGDLSNNKSSSKQGKKVEQLRQRVQELEQSLRHNNHNNNVRVVVSDHNPNTDREVEQRIRELKEKHSNIEKEKLKALQESADKKDETISSLITAVKKQGATKTEDNKIQFITTWNMNRGNDSAYSANSDAEKKINSAAPITCVSTRSPAISDISSTEDELFVPKSSSDEKIVLSSRRRKSRKVKSDKAIERKLSSSKVEAQGGSQEHAGNTPRAREIQQEPKADKGMPKAEVGSRDHTVNQCESESSQTPMEHLNRNNLVAKTVSSASDSDASASSKKSEKSSSIDNDFFGIEPAAAKPVKSSMKKSSSAEGVSSTDDVPVVKSKKTPKKIQKAPSSSESEEKSSGEEVKPKKVSKKVKKPAAKSAENETDVSSADNAPAKKISSKAKKPATSIGSDVSSSGDIPEKASKKGKKPSKPVASQDESSEEDVKTKKSTSKPTKADKCEEISSEEDIKKVSKKKKAKPVESESSQEEVVAQPKKATDVKKASKKGKKPSKPVASQDKSSEEDVKTKKSTSKPTKADKCEEISSEEDIKKVSKKKKAKPVESESSEEEVVAQPKKATDVKKKSLKDIAEERDGTDTLPPPKTSGKQKTTLKQLEEVISDSETPALPPSGKQKKVADVASRVRATSFDLKLSDTENAGYKPTQTAAVAPAKKKLPIWLQPTPKPEDKSAEKPAVAAPIPRRSDKELPIWLQSSSSKAVSENLAADTSVKDVPKAGRRRTSLYAEQNDVPDWLTPSNTPKKEEPVVRRNMTSRRSMTAEQVIANAHGSFATTNTPSVDSTARRNTIHYSEPYTSPDVHASFFANSTKRRNTIGGRAADKKF